MADAAVEQGIGATLVHESDVRWRIPRRGSMRVPGVVFASESLLPAVQGDRSLEQVCNVATLPGIVEASYAMPDIHWGYGFPIGGVAATDIAAGGVISPGGVGFDISCGVRLLLSRIEESGLAENRTELLDHLARSVPRGMGPGGAWHLSDRDFTQLLRLGARHAIERGYGVPADAARCEPVSAELLGSDPREHVSERALARGRNQVGSLGSGNHFLEVQVVDELLDSRIAERFGLFVGQITVMIHSGSRGLGHQICTDHVATMDDAMARYGIEVPDRQLACVPVESPEGRAYLSAMNAAANYGRANRQVLTHVARQSFAAALGDGRLDVLYDVSHNLARLEDHEVDGERRRLCVHRKGATLALPPHHPDLPDDLADTGQPVLVPGSMGTASYVLAGMEGSGAFHSACHGAGRTMSRHAARRRIHGRTLEAELETQGVAVRGASARGLAEEAPFAYKDVDDVVHTCERAGLARRVARLRPIGVVKG